jgi:ABC-type glycerol-3-phosphate transport system permease component
LQYRRRVRSSTKVRKVSLWLPIAGVSLLFLFPFYWIFSRSVESSTEFSLGEPRLWPQHPTLSNYTTILTQDGLGRAVLNSILVSGLVSVVTVVLSCLAAYALARLVRRGRALVLSAFVIVGFFPVTAMIGPLFLLFQRAGVLDSFTAVVLADLIYTLPISTWLLTSLFERIPWELEEAAMVDGCGHLQALWRVIVPLAAPALVTVAILSFVMSWSDFVFALSFLQTPDRYTAPLAMVFLGQSKYQIFYNLTDAAVVIIVVPIVALVFVAQRRIVGGLTAGAIKQ